MKKCQHCGFENGADMNFCLNCGNQLPNFQTSPSQTEARTEILPSIPNQSIPTAEYKTAPKKSRKAFLIVGILGLLSVFGLGGIGLLWLAANSGASSNNARFSSPTPTPIKKTPTVAPKNSPSPATGNLAANFNAYPADSAINSNSNSETQKTTSADGTFTVKAKEGWQLSNIKVSGGQKFVLLAMGEINLKGIEKAAPEGITAKQYESRRLYKEFPTGALLMRTKLADGLYSKISYAGRKDALLWQNAPEETGFIEFCINDNAREGNEGEFTVTVAVADDK